MICLLFHCIISRLIFLFFLPRPSFEDPKRKIKDLQGGPVLVNLWETTCAACLAEFGEFRERRADIEASGLRIVPLTLDEQQVIVSFGERAPRLNRERAEELADLMTPVFGEVEADELRGHAAWLAGGEVNR